MANPTMSATAPGVKNDKNGANQRRLTQISAAYFDFFNGKSWSFNNKDWGAVGANCEHSGNTIYVSIPYDFSKYYALSVVNSLGFNLKIYYPMDGGYLARGASRKQSGKFMTFAIPRSSAVDPTGDEEDGRYFSSPIWDRGGHYTFIVTKYLPSWHADFDGDAKAKDFEIKAYCSLNINN